MRLKIFRTGRGVNEMPESCPLSIALQAGAIGCRVFPVHPENKKPLVKGWPTVASADAEKIKIFWSQFPDAMIGAVTGHKSGFFVIDVDVRPEKNVDGLKSLKALEEKHGRLKPTMLVGTPGGGFHFYYKMPSHDIRSRPFPGVVGIDIKANGGYIVWPGSVRADGKMYRVLNKRDF
jgi:putative DNA primase/helicase